MCSMWRWLVWIPTSSRLHPTAHPACMATAAHHWLHHHSLYHHSLYTTIHCIPPFTVSPLAASPFTVSPLAASPLIGLLQVGGSSMSAGQLVSKLRKRFECKMSVADCFSHATVADMATLIAERQTTKKAHTSEKGGAVSPEFEEKFRESVQETAARQNSLCTWLVQSVPLVVLYPIRRILVWMVFLYIFVFLLQNGFERLPGLITSFVVANIVTSIFKPVLAVMLKWMIICQHRAGAYPLWGCYYLRWWTVGQCVLIFNSGMFSNDKTCGMMLRMLGARVGRNADISRTATMTEMDLLDVGNEVTIGPKAILKPFHMHPGRMCMKPISVGDGARVELGSIVAPGHSVKPRVTIGALSSSYEMSEDFSDDPTEPADPPLWMQVLFGGPLVLMVQLVSWSPVILLIWCMTSSTWYNDALKCGPDYDEGTCVVEVFDWFTHNRRILFYLAMRVTHKVRHTIRRPLLPTYH